MNNQVGSSPQLQRSELSERLAALESNTVRMNDASREGLYIIIDRLDKISNRLNSASFFKNHPTDPTPVGMGDTNVPSRPEEGYMADLSRIEQYQLDGTNSLNEQIQVAFRTLDFIEKHI